MKPLDEFGLIERYFKRSPARDDVLLGIGDDAAVVKGSGPIAVTVDTLVAGIHFPDDLPPGALGHRILAVNLSDLAAMGARPRWATLALTVPTPDPEWFREFSSGLFSLAERFDVALIGGDLCRGPLSATLQVIGGFDGEDRLTRGGAAPDDDIYVTGTLGDAAAGLGLMGEPDGGGARTWLRERFARPEPRVDAGLALVSIATAAIDVSDGLLADLGHVCEASGCGAVVDADSVPLSAELRSACAPDRAIELALAGGDDYELCFTAPAARAAAISAAAAATGTPMARIGSIVAGDGVLCLRGGEPYAPQARGYRHF
jgi:thiamine-monophosphate kinase